MRFSWIQAQWGRSYIAKAKDAILELVRLHFSSALFHSYDLQMREYHSRKLPASEATVTASPTKSVRSATVHTTPTRFKLRDSVYNKPSTRNAFSVESEFQKYASGTVLSDEMDILRFWEVKRFL